MSKKYIIAIILIILIIAIASAGFGIWRLSKKENDLKRIQQTREEVMRSLSAPASTTKTTQNLTREEKTVINSVSAPIKKESSTKPIKKEIIDSLSTPELK